MNDELEDAGKTQENVEDPKGNVASMFFEECRHKFTKQFTFSDIYKRQNFWCVKGLVWKKLSLILKHLTSEANSWPQSGMQGVWYKQ